MDKNHSICRLIGALAPAFLILSGCGGNGATSPITLPHGDGSIPLGRARNSANRSTTVDVGFPDHSHLTLNVPASGIVSVPSTMPDGPYTITISTDANDHQIVFTDDPNAHKTNLFDVMLLPEKRAAEVTAVTLGQPGGIVLSLGSTVKLKATVSGTNINGLTPSFWTSGGIGEITNGGVFKGVAPGTGTVTVDVLGFEDTIAVTVVP